MASVAVTYTFSANTTAASAEVNQNYTDLVNYINNRNDGSATWDAVYVASASIDPVGRFNNSTGTNDILRCQDNGSNVFVVADGGIITQATQPSFNVTNSAGQTNVTGDGTNYTVVFNTETFDQNADFGSNTFTAPVTGRYLLTCLITIQSLEAASTQCFVRIVTSNRSYVAQEVRDYLASDRYTGSIAVVADMDASDTATVTTQVDGGTKVVGLQDTVGCKFTGQLIA